MYQVLIAEDEVFVRLGYKTLINWKKLGMEVAADAANGEEALKAYERIRPQVVITDIKMPVMDGLTLIRKIRETDKHTRILILTCLEEFELVREALELGVSGYVLKLTSGIEDLERKLTHIREELDAQNAENPPKEPGGDDGLPPKARAALRYMDENYAADISLQIVSDYVGVTPSYLSRLLTAAGSPGFSDRLNAIRVDHAKTLLRNVSLTVGEVGRRVGFTNATYFIRVFKKLEGRTPNEYRTEFGGE